MGRNFGATDKKKGTQANETAIAGVTEASDYLQKMLGDPSGMKLDQSIDRAAHTPVEKALD